MFVWRFRDEAKFSDEVRKEFRNAVLSASGKRAHDIDILKKCVYPRFLLRLLGESKRSPRCEGTIATIFTLTQCFNPITEEDINKDDLDSYMLPPGEIYRRMIAVENLFRLALGSFIYASESYETGSLEIDMDDANGSTLTWKEKASVLIQSVRDCDYSDTIYPILWGLRCKLESEEEKNEEEKNEEEKHQKKTKKRAK